MKTQPEPPDAAEVLAEALHEEFDNVIGAARGSFKEWWRAAADGLLDALTS